jgi:hypothetical protein
MNELYPQLFRAVNHWLTSCFGRKKEDNMSIKLIAVDMDGTFLNDEMAYNKERFMNQETKAISLSISGKKDVSCAYWFPLATANLIPRAFNS